MKKRHIILCTILLFFITSCSSLFNQNTDKLNFKIDNSTAKEIQKSLLKNTTIQDKDIVSISCFLDGLNLPVQTKQTKLKEISKTTFSYTKIPYYKKFNIVLTVSFDEIPLYEGISKDINLNTENIDHTVELKLSKYKIEYHLNGGKK